MFKLYTKILLFIFLGLFSCTEKKTKTINPVDVYISLPLKVRHPKNNISSPEKIKLGKLLFYDPILSGNKDIACASCHHPSYGYAEALDISIGTNGSGLSRQRKFNKPTNNTYVKRNAHTILNTAYNGIDIKGNYTPEKAPMFWDSRIKTLEQQSLQPILTFEEMRGAHFSKEEILDTVVNRLKKINKYTLLFQKAFPKKPNITELNIAKAIATFERTLTTPNSRFDKYIAGDSTAISKGEKKGFELFKKSKCNSCHSGPMFSDYKIHTLSVPDNEKLDFSDTGAKNSYGFRTPTLRNLRYTAPYMHNGKLKTLKEVLEFYEDISFGKPSNKLVSESSMDNLLSQVKIKATEMNSIISFLNTLNNNDYDKVIPKKVPSNLSVGGNIN